jgi:hypothetical protein
MEDFLAPPIVAWAHGLTGQCSVQTLHNVRLVSNQLNPLVICDPPGESHLLSEREPQNEDFAPEFVLSIDGTLRFANLLKKKKKEKSNATNGACSLRKINRGRKNCIGQG